MDKIYLVKYSGNECDDFNDYIIFATTKKTTATKYVAKFNLILKKWKKYYSQFEYEIGDFTWIKDEFVGSHFYRWNSLKNINKCYYEEVKIR